jgi:hypothetical protein
MKVSFAQAVENVTREDYELIDKIARRAADTALRVGGYHVDHVGISMDLAYVHGGLCRLRLQELLDASDFNLAHDTAGIGKHLNRKTGELMDGFLPRYAETIS